MPCQCFVPDIQYTNWMTRGTYTIDAPPPPEPRQPINWHPKGVEAIRKPINALWKSIGRTFWENVLWEDVQRCRIPESRAEVPLDLMRWTQIQFFKVIHANHHTASPGILALQNVHAVAFDRRHMISIDRRVPVVVLYRSVVWHYSYIDYDEGVNLCILRDDLEAKSLCWKSVRRKEAVIVAANP